MEGVKLMQIIMFSIFWDVLLMSYGVKIDLVIKGCLDQESWRFFQECFQVWEGQGGLLGLGLVFGEGVGMFFGNRGGVGLGIFDGLGDGVCGGVMGGGKGVLFGGLICMLGMGMEGVVLGGSFGIDCGGGVGMGILGGGIRQEFGGWMGGF